MNPLCLAGALLLAAPASPPAVDCFGPGTDALEHGRGAPALAAFQAAFGHPGCRHHRGALLLNMATAFTQLAEETGDVRYACAAAVRYRSVVDEPATPRMLAAAERGARAAGERCGDRRLSESAIYGELGLEEIFDESSATAMATTLTVGAVGTLAAGGIFLALAAEHGADYDAATARLAAVSDPASDPDEIQRALNAAGEAHEARGRDEVLAVALLSVGGALTVLSIWSWLDLSQSGLAVAPAPGGAAIVGAW